jgi:hypothetical protein
MNDTLIQALIWLGAGVLLFFFVRKRRTRRTQQ